MTDKNLYQPKYKDISDWQRRHDEIIWWLRHAELALFISIIIFFILFVISPSPYPFFIPAISGYALFMVDVKHRKIDREISNE